MGVIQPNHNNDFLIWNEIGHLFPLKAEILRFFSGGIKLANAQVAIPGNQWLFRWKRSGISAADGNQTTKKPF